MPKCKINGHDIEVKEGATIIEAFKQMDKEIAHYCWHPGLSIAGVCRLCMVEIEGHPRLQIACNTTIQEGMVITNQSEKVKDTVKWGLDFHLINHPLDCPICDQAGECGLQDQYMKFGQYDPEMSESKVKKRKVVDLGKRVVLDTERCILCSRCVRFTEEVTETRELGIFNRGDRSEVGTFTDKPLNNNYSINTVDICPVGALTSKDFRFQQRVWYLKESDTICTGCSTGCNITAFHNEEGLFRLKPRYNPEVNGYWMCDKGRELYKHVNRKERLTAVMHGQSGQWNRKTVNSALVSLGAQLRSSASKIGLVVTGQYSNEEYKALFDLAKTHWNVSVVHHWLNHPEQKEEFDGLLYRGDQNPNTKGLELSLQNSGLNTVSFDDFTDQLHDLDWVVVLGPEYKAAYGDIETKVEALSSGKVQLVWMTANKMPELDHVSATVWQVPIKTYLEKNGTYTNFKNLQQTVKASALYVSQALDLEQVTKALSGEEVQANEVQRPITEELKSNQFVHIRGDI